MSLTDAAGAPVAALGTFESLECQSCVERTLNKVQWWPFPGSPSQPPSGEPAGSFLSFSLLGTIESLIKRCSPEVDPNILLCSCCEDIRRSRL